MEDHDGQRAVNAPAPGIWPGAPAQETPEVQRHAGLAQHPIFVPTYGAFRQGIVLTYNPTVSNLDVAFDRRFVAGLRLQLFDSCRKIRANLRARAR